MARRLARLVLLVVAGLVAAPSLLVALEADLFAQPSPPKTSRWTPLGLRADGGALDAGSLDAGALDAGSLDAGSLDAGAPALVRAATPGAPPEASPSPVTVAFPEGVPTPLRVGVGLGVNNLGKIDEVAGTFEASIDLRARWRDPRQAFDARALGTDRRELTHEAATAKLAEMWVPQLAITNLCSDKPSHVESVVFLQADGSVVLLQRVEATFKTSFNGKAFPFDSQSLDVSLASARYGAAKLVLTQEQADYDYSGIRQGAGASGFDLTGLDLTNSTSRGLSGSSVPQVDAHIRVARQWQGFVLGIFVPFLAIMVVPTVLTLYVKVSTEGRLNAWSGAILALIALCFSFGVSYPGATAGDALIAQLETIGFGFQILMLGLSMTVLSPELAERVRRRYVLDELARTFRWSIPLAFVTLVLQRILSMALSSS